MPKTAFSSIILAASVLALAIMFNPTPDRHRAKIKAVIEDRSQLADALGLGSITAFITTYHSLILASYTTVNERTVSFGVFGMVFVLD